MRVRLFCFGVLLTVRCLTCALAWAHGDGTAGPIPSGHRPHSGGAGTGGTAIGGTGAGAGHSWHAASGGNGSPEHAGHNWAAGGAFGSPGHSGHGWATGGGFSGNGSAGIGPGPHVGAPSVGGYGAAIHHSGENVSGIGDISRLSRWLSDHQSAWPAAGRSRPMMAGIDFPISPGYLHRSEIAPMRPQAPSVPTNSLSIPHRAGLVHDLVRSAASGGLTEHHAGGQINQTSRQQVTHAEQAELSHRQAGPVIERADSRRRLETASNGGQEGDGKGRPGAARDLPLRARSVFFGGSTPFKDSPPATDDAPATSNSTTNTLVFVPWLPGFGLGYGFGFFGITYSTGGYGGSYGVPLTFATGQPIASAARLWPSYPLNVRRAPPVVALTAVQVGVDEAPAEEADNALDFAVQGETDFKQRKYKSAVQNWKHALVDDPRNGAIVLLLGQALFAVGDYDDAAAATQAALMMLPEEKWGTVVTHYKELYSNVADYTTQIRALEKARDAKPDSPALHFLLGYHFGYLKYPKQAVRELDKVLVAFPKDKVAQKLRDEFAGKLSEEDNAALEKQKGAAGSDAKAETDAKSPPDQPQDAADETTDAEGSDKKNGPTESRARARDSEQSAKGADI